jgi:hypothetical protein
MKNHYAWIVLGLAACTAEFETSDDPTSPFQQEEQKPATKATGPADAKYLQCKGVETVVNMDFSQAKFESDEVESSLTILRKFDSLSVEMVTMLNRSLIRVNEQVQFEFASDNTTSPTYKIELSTQDFINAQAKLIGQNFTEEMTCEFFQSEK